MKQKLSNIIQKINNFPLVIKIALIIAVILIACTFLLLILDGSTKEENDQATQPTNQNLLYATLLFNPSTIQLDPARIQSAPIMLDLGENSAKKVTFSVRYDPESVTLIDLIQKLDPTSPLSNSFTTESVSISTTEGIAIITLSLKEGAIEQMGSGEIAQFSFRINPEYKGKLGFAISDVTIESDNSKDKIISPQTNILIVTSN